MKLTFITDLLFSTSIKASIARVVAVGIGWLLSGLTGLSLFADLELPSAEWVGESSSFVTAVILTLVAHLVSIIGSKKQKSELPK